MKTMCSPLGCDCSCGDFNGPDVWSSKIVRARVRHTCCECGDKILPGEQYEAFRGCWDGNWDTYETCCFCLKLRETYCHHGYVFGELEDTLKYCLGFRYTSDPGDCPEEPREPDR